MYYMYLQDHLSTSLSTSCNPFLFLKWPIFFKLLQSDHEQQQKLLRKTLKWRRRELRCRRGRCLGTCTVLGSLKMCPLLTPWQISHKTCATKAIVIVYFIVPVSMYLDSVSGCVCTGLRQQCCAGFGPSEVVDHRMLPLLFWIVF